MRMAKRTIPESIETLHKALELGINFWDTADVYGNGANEELISHVLVPNRDKIFIATKFGFQTTADFKMVFRWIVGLYAQSGGSQPAPVED